MDTTTEAEELFLEAAERLREAEIEEAETFLEWKFKSNPPLSDWTARAHAMIQTQGRVQQMKALAAMYHNRMKREVRRANPV